MKFYFLVQYLQVFYIIFITSRNRGGGHKRLYRKIDFKRNYLGVNAKVVAIEYDPNRNARIALINYVTGRKAYILHPRDLSISSVIISDFDAPVKVGNALPLSKIPLGTNVHNIEFQVRSVSFNFIGIYLYFDFKSMKKLIFKSYQRFLA